MKRVLLFFFCVLILFCSSNAFAEFDLAKASRELSSDVFKEASKIPEKPHFLLGIEPKATAWEKYQEIRKMSRTKERFYGAGVGTDAVIDKSAASHNADTTLQENIVVGGRNVYVVYLGHHFDNGMYTFWGKTGEKNLAEFSPIYEKYKVKWALGNLTDAEWYVVEGVLGWAQFEAVKQFTHDLIKNSAEGNAQYYAAFDFLKKILVKRADILGDKSYLKEFDALIPGADRLRVNDVIPVPYVRVEDFIPDVFIIGPGKFEGGLAYWKLPETERLVYVSIFSVMYEYITGNYRITRHEFTHTNPYLQNLVTSAYFDLEVWADMVTGLLPGNSPMEFLRHPYMAQWRDLVKTQWGYDSEEVMRKIHPISLGGPGIVDISRKEFEENAARVEVILKELQRFVEKLLVKFYGDPLKWSDINTKFCDTSAALRINFVFEYKSAGLNDREKLDKEGKVIPPLMQTQEWLMGEVESGRIERLTKLSLEKTGSKTKIGEGMSKLADTFNTRCPVNSSIFLMRKKDRLAAEHYVEALWERAKAGDWIARTTLMQLFGSKELLQSIQKQEKGGAQ